MEKITGMSGHATCWAPIAYYVTSMPDGARLRWRLCFESLGISMAMQAAVKLDVTSPSQIKVNKLPL
ncbi:MAG: hypothetical protein AAB466_09120 [Verrucomicrobiota bacterium]